MSRWLRTWLCLLVIGAAAGLNVGPVAAASPAIVSAGSTLPPGHGEYTHAGYRRYHDDDDDDDDDDDGDYSPPEYYEPPPPRTYRYAPPPAVYYDPPAYGWMPPPRPMSCGKYRYWNGEFCADARYRPPYVGPRW